MSQLVECDNCGLTYNQTFGSAEDTKNYTTNWHHNSDYDFDACSDKCNEILCDEYYSIYRCSLCKKEFDEMPADGMHTVHGQYKYMGVDGSYIDVDGECGPVYKV